MSIAPYKHKIQFYETDQMGIVHHSNYIRWFEEARVDFMEQLGLSYHKVVSMGVDIAVVGVSCEYKSMTKFSETVQINVHISKMTPVRMTVEYKVLGSENGELCATGETRHCFIRRIDQRPVSLAKELPELFELLKGKFQNDV